jgi:hypothetical protein
VHERQGGGSAQQQRRPGRVAAVLCCEEGGDGDSRAGVGQMLEWAGRADVLVPKFENENNNTKLVGLSRVLGLNRFESHRRMKRGFQI